MPFGFDTRVVALWRSGEAKPNGLSGFIRRVMIVSAAVLIISGGAAAWEISRGLDANDLSGDEYAIADSAIQSEFYR